MYVLFKDAYAYAYADTIPAFAIGLKLDDASNLQKTVTTTEMKQLTDGKGNKLYKDKNGVLTTQSKYSQPAMETVSITKQVYFLQSPDQFDKIDIMKYKKEQLLAKHSEYSDCRLYEFNLNQFFDPNICEHVDIGLNDIKIRAHGTAKTIEIPINGTKIHVSADSDGEIKTYISSDGNKFGKSEKIANNKAYIAFKNTTDQPITLTGFQILISG